MTGPERDDLLHAVAACIYQIMAQQAGDPDHGGYFPDRYRAAQKRLQALLQGDTRVRPSGTKENPA